MCLHKVSGQKDSGDGESMKMGSDQREERHLPTRRLGPNTDSLSSHLYTRSWAKKISRVGGTPAGSARASRRRRRRTERTPPPPPPLAGKGAGKRWVIASPSVCSGRRRTRETRRGSPVSAVPVCWPKAGHRREGPRVIG